MKGQTLWTILLLCVVMVMPVSALYVDAGESWVSWEWDLESDQRADVYINGALVSENGTMESYLLSGLSAGEQAHIVVCNATSGEELISNYAMTNSPIYVNIIILGIMLVLAIVSYGVAFEMGIAIGGFNILLGLVLLNISMGISMIPYLALGALIFQVVIMAIGIYERISDVLGWF